ncbi:hypothetical protein GC175_30450 [bacterium]|nr:hypothetical protein [bacterium]
MLRHILLVLLVLVMTACSRPSVAIDYVSKAPTAAIPNEIPPLPFSDNPDPLLCGIPEPYWTDDPGLVTGEHDGELVQPVVYLYNSHLRSEITGQVYPNTRVKIVLSQSNPELDYFFVETIDLAEKQSGWIPAPFLIEPNDL